MPRLATLATVTLALALVAVTFDAVQPPAAGTAPRSPVRLLAEGGTDSGYARAERPRPFEFPRDHGAHPDFQTEWWYFTGNLASPDGRPFGYQLTFFRLALSPAAIDGASPWRTRQALVGHFSVSDISGRRFAQSERFARAALTAGFSDEPARVWIRDWSITQVGNAPERWRLSAGSSTAGTALDLELIAGAPPIEQGDRGFSIKSEATGSASYYYSEPRLTTRGTLTVDGTRYPVSGASWLDREWSTSALAPDQEGWDWFALHFDDGRDLMLYRLRGSDGSVDGASRGTLRSPDGTVSAILPDGFTLQPRRYWRSRATGIRYPVEWRLRIPAAGIDAIVAARVDDQEWTGRLRYWEGSVAVSSTRDRDQALGLGYMELAGYAAP